FSIAGFVVPSAAAQLANVIVTVSAAAIRGPIMPRTSTAAATATTRRPDRGERDMVAPSPTNVHLAYDIAPLQDRRESNACPRSSSPAAIRDLASNSRGS